MLSSKFAEYKSFDVQTLTLVRKQEESKRSSFFIPIGVAKLFSVLNEVRVIILNQSQEQAKLIANNKGGLYYLWYLTSFTKS